MDMGLWFGNVCLCEILRYLRVPKLLGFAALLALSSAEAQDNCNSYAYSIPSHPIPFHSQHVARSMLMSRADLRIAVLCFCVIRCGAPPTDPHETRTMSVKPSAGGIPVAHDWYDWYDLVAFVVTYFLIWFIFQDYLYHVLQPVGDVRVLRWGDGVHFIFGLVQMLVAFGVPWICFGAHLVSEQQGLTWEAHCFYLLVEGLALPWQVIAPLKTEALNTGRPSVRTQISAWRVPLLGYTGVAAEFYVFNLQLLWCAEQYLDSVSAVLAFYSDYPLKLWMLGMLLTSYVLQSVAAWIAGDDREFSNRMFVAMLAGISPSGMPEDMARTMKLIRFSIQNLPQIYFQISMALWHGNMIFPWISAAVSSCFAIKEFLSEVGSLFAADLGRPAEIETQSSSEWDLIWSNNDNIW